MRSTMKRTLALVLALMLAMPTFVLADGAAVAQDANGQITANELVLNDSLVPDDDLVPDGDLALDGMSLELPQPEDPSGDLELGSQDPAEGGAGEQPDALEVGAPEEPPLELGDDAQAIEEEIPDPRPLMPPDYALDTALEGENAAAMVANGDKTPWQQLADDFISKSAITLTTDCIASDGDTRLLTATDGSFALNLDGNTINRNLNNPEADGNVIYVQGDLNIYGTGKITGGKIVANYDYGYGGGIAVYGAKTLTLNSGVEITGNLADSGNSSGCGGGVILGRSDSATGKNRLIMNNSAIKSNTAVGFGGGVFLDDYAELEMNNGAIISDNYAQEGGGVVVDSHASFNMKGGSITGNHAKEEYKGFGGGVSLREDSTFTMENGQITGNHADYEGGGGVYIKDKSTFTMTGGTIEGNFADSADGNGGGVYVEGTFSIGADNKTSTITITGNTKGEKANNVYLPENIKIRVNGKLSEGSKIGVTMAKPTDGSGNPIPFTDGLGAKANGLIKIFESDDSDNYAVSSVGTDAAMEAVLLPKIKTFQAKDLSIVYDGKDHGIAVTDILGPNDVSVANPSISYGDGAGTYSYTISPTVKNVSDGEKTVYFKIEATNYYPAEGSAKVQITAKEVTLDWSGEDAYTYSGQGEGPGATIKSGVVGQDEVGVTVQYKAKGADDSTLTGKKPTDAGDYVAVAKLNGAAKGNYSLPSNTTKAFTIKAQELDNDKLTITLDPAEYTYDGTAKKPTVTVTDKNTSQVVPVKEYTVAYTNNVNAGTATVTLTDVAGGNYVVEGAKTFTIKEAAMVVEANGYKGVYDGKAHGIAVSVTKPSTGYTVMYGSKAGTYDKKGLTYTDAGNYTVFYQVTAPNYETVTGSAAVEITARQATMTVAAKSYKGEYDGKAHGITVNVTEPKTGYTVKYGEKEGTYDKKGLTYTDAGVYTVYYQVTADNYETVTGSAAVEITAKASDNLIIILSQTEYTYDGTAKEPAVTVTDKDTRQVVPASEYEVAYGDNVNAGTAKVTLTDVAGGNYIVNGDQTFTINKAAMTVEANDYKGVYDGKAHGIAVSVTDPKKGHTVKYGEKEGTYNRDSLTYTDAGVYTVYYQVTAKNYETVTGSATVEITAKELDNDRDGDGIEDADSNAIITLEPAEYTYDGKAKKPLVTVTDKDTGVEVPLWEFRLYFSNNVNIGTAKVTISDAEGGNYTVKGVKTFAIKGKPMTVAANGYEGKYDGEAHGITVNVIEPSTGYTVKYGTVEGTYDRDSLTYTDVGVYTVYYQVTAENYETVTGSATVEITANEKASMTVAVEDYKGEYDGEAHGIKVTVTEPKTGYTVKYSTVDGTYDKESLTYTDAGVYTVYYQVTAKNYETVTGSATVEITARVPTDLTINLSAKTYYYYAKARKPTVTVMDGDTVVPESEYRVTYKNNIHAGTATVKITSFTKGNYRFAEERNFTIKPRNVHLKYTKLTFTYDGKYHLPLAKAIGVYPADENKYNVIMTGSGRNVGRYIARTTGIDNPDYHMLDVGEETRVIFYINPRGGRSSSDSGNTRFVAEKKIGTMEIGTVTYNGKAQEPRFEVKCVFDESNGVVSNEVLTVPASEYRVTFHNNVDAGTATVEVTDVPGGNFIVDFHTEFTIAPRKATVTAKDQDVTTVGDVKTGVKAVKAKGLAKGHVLESVKLDVRIKEGAKKGAIIPGKVKIVDAEGKDVTRNYKLDYVAGSLAVTAPKPAEPDFTLLAQMTVSGKSKTALKLAWTDVADAYAYDVYFARCGSEFKLKKTVKATEPCIVRFKDLDKRVSHKAYVKAWKMVNDQKVYIGNASPQVHAITGGYTSQACNTQSVKLNRTRLTLKAGGSDRLEAKLKGVKSGKKLLDHVDKVRWYSTDANVATVDANGKVNAVGKGSCKIYAIANNGVRSSAKVKVK